MTRNQTLSGKPTMPSARSARAWLVNDAIWHPTYNSLVAAVLVVWITVLLIGLAAWSQVLFPAASQPVPQAEAQQPTRVEAVAGDEGIQP